MTVLSIIIPHYNSTASLEQLLNTIPKFREIQVIVVDDHSNEWHKKNLMKLEENNKHKNIMFINNIEMKKGAGACRNIGIKNAIGKWLLFADADDFFLDDFFDIVQKYCESTAEVVFFKPTSIEIDTGKVSDRHLPFIKLIDDYLEAKNSKREMHLRYRFVVPWSKLINRSFLEEYKIYFDEVISANDVMFSTKVGHFMKRFEISKEVIYCVTKNKGSLTMTINQEVFDSRINVFVEYYQYLKKRLSNEDFKSLKLSGRGYIINSAKFGIGVLFSVYFKLRENRIRIIDKSILNPYLLIKKILLTYNKNKKEKRFQKKI